MADRPYPVITVNEKAARAIRGGHPWVYGAETSGPDRPCQNGEIVDVVSPQRPLAGGGLPQRPLQDPGAAALPEHQRPVRRGLLAAAAPVCPGLPEKRHGPGLRLLPADLRGGRPVPPASPWTGSGTSWSPRSSPWGWRWRKDLLYPLLVELLREDGVAVRAIYERSDAPPPGNKEGLPRLTGFYPPPRPGHGSGRPPPPGGERHPVRRGLHPRPEDRLLPGPEVQPPGRRRPGPRPAGAGLLHPTPGPSP